MAEKLNSIILWQKKLTYTWMMQRKKWKTR